MSDDRPIVPADPLGEAARELAEVWPPEKVVMLLRKVHELAVKARDENASGDMVLRVQLVSGRPIECRAKSEERVW